MKRIFSAVALAALAPVAASAERDSVTCVKAGDERTIEIFAPGEIGAACDVRYARKDGAEASVPYHADNSSDFCSAKAVELAQTLTEAGYDCTPEAGGTVDAALGEESGASEPLNAEPALAESTTDGAPETMPSAAVMATAQQTDAIAADYALQANAQPGAVADGVAEVTGRPVLVQPSMQQTAAVRGPEQLAPGADQAHASAGPAAAVGRLVGAPPDAPPTQSLAATRVTPAAVIASAQAPEPSIDQPAIAPQASADAPAETIPVAAPVAAPARPAPARKPEDVIRATLEAQAAAWNEGNLEAFMATYWKSDDLKFISGIDVAKGWSSTMKRYRERYADDSGLGWLSFDKLEVMMATDDVAVATGRFNHSKGDQASSGVFSLVMRRQDGVWRIVHDHTSVDPKTGE